MGFEELVASLPQVGLDHHRDTILENSRRNARCMEATLRSIVPNPDPCLILSAGPSLYRKKIIERIYGKFNGTVIATDGAYLQCLRGGVLPAYVISIDPHPTRMIRWFGDPDLEKNSKGDDYFDRQDLDVRMRKVSADDNAYNIELVNQTAKLTRFIVASTCPENVIARLRKAKANLYWFAPLVDDPDSSDSLTRQMVEITDLPAMNTGATVGTAAWVFAHQILRSKNIAVAGFDFSYPFGTKLEQTQEWNMLKDESFYPRVDGIAGEVIASPTYAYYLRNLRDLLDSANARITNCSEEGMLAGLRIDVKPIESWLASFS